MLTEPVRRPGRLDKEGMGKAKQLLAKGPALCHHRPKILNRQAPAIAGDLDIGLIGRAVLAENHGNACHTIIANDADFTLPPSSHGGDHGSDTRLLGAEQDAIFTVDEVRRTARAYRTEAEILPRLGHDMMLDQGWQKVADRVDIWVQETTRDQSSHRLKEPAGHERPGPNQVETRPRQELSG